MPPMGFEPTFSAGERPQTYALDRAATGTGMQLIIPAKIQSGPTKVLHVSNFFPIPPTTFSIHNSAKLLKIRLTVVTEQTQRSCDV